MPILSDRDPHVLVGSFGSIPDFSDVTTKGYSPLGKIKLRSSWSDTIKQVRPLRNEPPISVIRDYDTSALLPVDPRTYEALVRFIEGLDKI